MDAFITRTFGNDLTIRPAANPFQASSKFITDARDEELSVSWMVKKHPQAGTVTLSADVRIDEAQSEKARLDISIIQNDKSLRRSFDVTDGKTRRIGLLFDNDGSPYRLTVSLAVEVGSKISVEILPFEALVLVNADVCDFTRLSARPGTSLVSCNQGGLMNRLIPLMSLLKIGREHNRTVSCIWSANEHCAAKFEDLFDLGDKCADSFAAERYDQLVAYENVENPLDLQRNVDTLAHAIAPIKTINPESATSLSEVGEEFRKLKLSRAVLHKLSAFDMIDFTNVIGFHIRRPYPNGAFAEQENAKFTLGVDVFIDLISQLKCSLPEYRRVLVCTNDLSVEKKITDEFGEFVFTFQKSSIDNTTSATAVQEAMVDLILLSRCKILFSQETTAFGTIAHVIGRNKLYAVTRQTDGDNFHLWGWHDGVHTSTLVVPRSDITKLVDSARE